MGALYNKNSKKSSEKSIFFCLPRFGGGRQESAVIRHP